MKEFDKRLAGVMNDFATDYSEWELFEELFPGLSPGEIVVDMYYAGLIPEDKIEEFLIGE